WRLLSLMLFLAPLTARADRWNVVDQDPSREAPRRFSSHAPIPLDNAQIAKFVADLQQAGQQARLKEMFKSFLGEGKNSDPRTAWKKSAQLQEGRKKILSQGEAAAAAANDPQMK